jgi:hypothetical protein
MKTLLFRFKTYINRIRFNLPVNRRHRELLSLLRSIFNVEAVFISDRKNEYRYERLESLLERVLRVMNRSPASIPSTLSASVEKLDSIIELMRSEPFAALKTWVDRTEREHVRQSKIIDELTCRWKGHAECLTSEIKKQESTIDFLKTSFKAVQDQNLMLVELLAKTSVTISTTNAKVPLTCVSKPTETKAVNCG